MQQTINRFNRRRIRSKAQAAKAGDLNAFLAEMAGLTSGRPQGTLGVRYG